jgi:hypothetical protein
MLSIEEDGELLKRDVARKPDRQYITAVVRKPVGIANCRSLFCRASELKARQELLDRLVPAYEGEAQHSTEAPHLSSGELVLRVRLQAGVEDSFYRRVPLQEASDLYCVLIVTRDAELESLQATK